MTTTPKPASAPVTLQVARDFVGGSFVDSTATAWQDIPNPATNTVIGRVPLGGKADVDRAVASAKAAFPAWRNVPPHERARYLFRLRTILERERENLARLVTLEMGKTLADSRGEIQRGIENVETACGIPTLMMGYGLEDGAAHGIDEHVVYQPLGVFAAICPFNFPFMIPFWFWPYAVAAGNTFVVKPSERVPLVQQRVFELIAEAGFPPGVVNLVNGGKDAVDALLDHPDVRGISFVGSTPVAKYVYARASANGKRVQAQGGAKNVLVVMSDVAEDGGSLLDDVMPNILGSCFGAAGQRCLAGSLIMPVGERAHALVRERLVSAARAMRVGDGLDPSTDVGPVISAAARDRIVAAIDRGVREGADLLVDGRQPSLASGSAEGYFVGPTVFDNVRPAMALAREEIFGPVVGIIPVASLDEAIEQINASPYGNASSIYTRNGAAARTFAMAVTTGNVGINVGVAAAMAFFPFGGMKDSFFGTLHGQGRDAVRFFTESKVVIQRWL